MLKPPSIIGWGFSFCGNYLLQTTGGIVGKKRRVLKSPKFAKLRTHPKYSGMVAVHEQKNEEPSETVFKNIEQKTEIIEETKIVEEPKVVKLEKPKPAPKKKAAPKTKAKSKTKKTTAKKTARKKK